MDDDDVRTELIEMDEPGLEDGRNSEEPAHCSTGGAICNLTVTAVGAGMFALPHALEQVGLLLGILLLFIVVGLTYFSSSIIVRFASARYQHSYAGLVKSEFGKEGSNVLQVSIILHVTGVMIVYLIVLADMLVGSAPAWDGLLPNALGIHTNPWFLTRGVVTAAVVLVFIAPMLVTRDLAVVAEFSRRSVYLMALLAIALDALAIASALEGRPVDVAVLPPLKGNTWLARSLGLASSSLSVMAVGILAFTCQFNLLPVQYSMVDRSTGNMVRVIKLALGLCFVLYGSVALAGYGLFGSRTDGDVLKNLTTEAVGEIVGPALGVVLVYAIVGSTAFNLMVNFSLKAFVVREELSTLVWDTDIWNMSSGSYFALTVVVVLVAYAVSVTIPSVYVLVSLIGSTACVLFSYVFPGLIAARNGASPLLRVGGRSIVVLAVVIALTTILGVVAGHVTA